MNMTIFCGCFYKKNLWVSDFLSTGLSLLEYVSLMIIGKILVSLCKIPLSLCDLPGHHICIIVLLMWFYFYTSVYIFRDESYVAITWYLHSILHFFSYRMSSHNISVPWWRYQIETFSALALLALCEGNSPVTGAFRSQRPVTRGFGVFFYLCLNKRLSEQLWDWWFETSSRS